MHLKYFIIIIKVWLIYKISSSSVVQQSDPITHIFLCCTVGSHCPSSPDMSLHPPNNLNVHPSHTHPSSPPQNPKSALLGHALFLFFVYLLFLDRIIGSIFQIPQISDIIWYLSFFFFKVTSVAYGGSQAKGQMKAIAASLHHIAMPDPSRVCDLHHSSQQHQIQ